MMVMNAKNGGWKRCAMCDVMVCEERGRPADHCSNLVIASSLLRLAPLHPKTEGWLKFGKIETRREGACEMGGALGQPDEMRWK